MKKLIDYLSAELGIGNKMLLEKDIIIHKLLLELLADTFFRENFVFKGGTCLTKCYFGYYRFSEDLDFTWKSQHIFSDRKQKEIRKELSQKINVLIRLLHNIALKLLLDFNPDKSNRRYIELGGSNKFSTFKFWYRSEISGEEQFVKIQINFLEFFLYPFNEMPAKSIIEGINQKEFSFLFPEEAESLLPLSVVKCYSLHEILIEKFRAILTRRSMKARDFIDVFVITQRKNIHFQALRPEILRKTAFMLRYDKYIQNLKEFNLKKVFLGEEQKLLLQPLEIGFEPFLEKMQGFLPSIAEELKNSLNGK